MVEVKSPQNFPSSPSFSFLRPPSFSSPTFTLYDPRPSPFTHLEPHPKAYLVPLFHLLLLTPFLFLWFYLRGALDLLLCLQPLSPPFLLYLCPQVALNHLFYLLSDYESWGLNAPPKPSLIGALSVP